MDPTHESNANQANSLSSIKILLGKGATLPARILREPNHKQKPSIENGESKAIVLNRFAESKAIVLNRFAEGKAIVLNRFAESKAIVLNRFAESKAIVLNRFAESKAIVLNRFSDTFGSLFEIGHELI